jgi:NAD(P)H-hydrate epimerase
MVSSLASSRLHEGLDDLKHRLSAGDADVDHRRHNVIVVLNGSDTVVATPDGLAIVNANVLPTLAKPDAGGLLAGLMLGMQAHGMAPVLAAAMWLHGAVTVHFGPGLIAEDLPDRLPAVLRSRVRESAADNWSTRPPHDLNGTTR